MRSRKHNERRREEILSSMASGYDWTAAAERVQSAAPAPTQTTTLLPSALPVAIASEQLQQEVAAELAATARELSLEELFSKYSVSS